MKPCVATPIAATASLLLFAFRLLRACHFAFSCVLFHRLEFSRHVFSSLSFSASLSFSLIRVWLSLRLTLIHLSPLIMYVNRQYSVQSRFPRAVCSSSFGQSDSACYEKCKRRFFFEEPPASLRGQSLLPGRSSQVRSERQYRAHHSISIAAKSYINTCV